MLLLLKSHLKNEINVQKSYGALPTVPCFVGQVTPGCFECIELFGATNISEICGRIDHPRGAYLAPLR
jgi:hypothetical protein